MDEEIDAFGALPSYQECNYTTCTPGDIETTLCKVKINFVIAAFHGCRRDIFGEWGDKE